MGRCTRRAAIAGQARRALEYATLQAKTHLSKLSKAAQAGEEVLITSGRENASGAVDAGVAERRDQDRVDEGLNVADSDRPARADERGRTAALGGQRKLLLRYLIGTQALLWAANDDPRLPKLATAVLLDENETIFVSAVSGYEIANKFRLGKLAEAAVLMRDFERWYESWVRAAAAYDGTCGACRIL